MNAKVLVTTRQVETACNGKMYLHAGQNALVCMSEDQTPDSGPVTHGGCVEVSWKNKSCWIWLDISFVVGAPLPGLNVFPELCCIFVVWNNSLGHTCTDTVMYTQS